MKIKYIFWSVTAIIQFFLCLYHELWHWIFAKILSLITLGDIFNIHLRVDRYPYKEINEDCTTYYETSMSIVYENYTDKDQKLESVKDIIIMAPVFGSIFLFIVSPVYMYLLYIPYMNTLWLSNDDVKQLKK